VQLEPQAATTGTAVDVVGNVNVPPGGEADLAVVARANSGAPAGENYGFVVLRKGNLTRRVPYLFLVSNPKLAGATVVPLVRTQLGATTRASTASRPIAIPPRRSATTRTSLRCKKTARKRSTRPCSTGRP